eukprot:3435558-Prorocentrum_lima.AAC.1
MVAQVRTEQVIDEWVKKTPAGKVIQGVLDVAWHEGRKEHTLDVSVAVTSTPDKKAQISRSQRQDATVDGRVHEKRQRYPAGGA